jgi:signal recognition particle receptor subunit alpha
VLWSRSFTPAFSALSNTPNSPVNALFKQSFIEGTTSDGFEKDGYSVRWTVDNGLGLVFVVVFPALLPLTYIPTLLDRTKELFLALFRPYLDSLPSLTLLHAKMAEEKWDLIFDRCLKSCEEKPRTRAVEPSESISAEEIAKNVQHLKSRLKRGKGKTPSPAPSPASKSKLMRKWDDSAISEKDMAALDYSQPTDNIEPVNVDHLVSSEAMGSRGADGSYEVADWDQGRLRSEAEILSATPRAEPESWGGLFSRLAGQKTITKQDLQPVLAEMEKHLMAKNVAKDIAEKLCDAVGTALVGKKLGGLSSVSRTFIARAPLTIRRENAGQQRPLSLTDTRSHSQNLHRHPPRYPAQAEEFT